MNDAFRPSLGHGQGFSHTCIFRILSERTLQISSEHRAFSLVRLSKSNHQTCEGLHLLLGYYYDLNLEIC